MTGLQRVPMAGGTKTLPASLTQKLTQQGVCDPEAALIKAAAQVIQSAIALRKLVRHVYTDDADLVLDNLRKAAKASGALDGDALAGLAAEADFYDKVAAEIQGAVSARTVALGKLDRLQESAGRGSPGHESIVTWVTFDLEEAQAVLDKFKEKTQ